VNLEHMRAVAAAWDAIQSRVGSDRATVYELLHFTVGLPAADLIKAARDLGMTVTPDPARPCSLVLFTVTLP